MTASSLADILGHARVLLLDFDGPICDMFAGRAAKLVTDDARALFAAHGGTITDELAPAEGPLQLLRDLADVDENPELTRTVTDAVRDAEITAVATAHPTPGSEDALQAASATGRRVAIVSNNADEAVRAYLNRHGLDRYVDRVIGRYDGMNLEFLKPHQHLVQLALDTLHAAPAETVFVGDSTDDIEAGHTAGVTTIGYANKPGKRDRLTAAGADTVIDTMTELADALRSVRTAASPAG